MRTMGGPPLGDAFLACPVCFELYESDGVHRPQQLDCGHSFCAACVQQWEQASRTQDGFSCPLCRRVSSIQVTHSPRGSSSDSVRSGMRVWIGPDGGVAWVPAEALSGAPQSFAVRFIKTVLGCGLAIIAALIGVIVVLTVQQSDHGSSKTGTPQALPDLVYTPLGAVRGRTLLAKDSSGQMQPVRAFLGVPYAEPPIGENRFRPAKKKLPWSGVLEALKNPPACTQNPEPRGVNMSESCLFLNVWSPAKPQLRTVQRHHQREHLPVMVWIHGGAFQWGHIAEYDGAELALATSSVVVTIQYRLGPLGFFQSSEIAREDLQFPAHGGANGIYDMIQSLRWVSNSISAFSGDHTKVTVFGAGLGGGLGVCSLVVSPWSAGLFHNAIIESGPCNGPWRPWELAVAIDHSKMLLSSLNISSVDQLRRVDARKLTCPRNTYGQADAPWQCSIDYSVDGWVLPSDPMDLYSKDGAVDYDVMLGASTLDTLAAPPFDSGYKPKNATDLRRLLSIFVGAGNASRIWRQYQHSRPTIEEIWFQISADVCAVCPTKWLADDMASSRHYSGATPYLYQYAGPAPDGVAPHTSEVVEIFGKGNAPSADPLAFSEELSNIMQEYWGAFAWGGVPYSGTAVATGALTWPVYRTKKADTSGSAQSEPNIWHRSKSEHQINEKHLNGSATLPVLWDSSFEGYMRLGREVVVEHEYKVTQNCDFWTSFELKMREDLCYETNPIPRTYAYRRVSSRSQEVRKNGYPDAS